MDEYEAYQTARVEGFIPADQSFEEYLLAEVNRLREVIDKEHPTFDWLSRQTIAKLDAEVNMLRERLIRAYDWAENAVNGNDSAMMDYTEYVCGVD